MQVDHFLRSSLSGSKKQYSKGELFPELNIPVRVVELTDGTSLPIYDTSGPYTDPSVHIDIMSGLPDVRSAWIEKRSDTEIYQGRHVQPKDNGYHDEGKSLANMASQLQRQPRRAKAGCNVTQMHYAKKGIITPEMEFAAIRENQNRVLTRQKQKSHLNLCVMKLRAAVPLFLQISIILN